MVAESFYTQYNLILNLVCEIRLILKHIDEVMSVSFLHLVMDVHIKRLICKEKHREEYNQRTECPSL